ncbi:alkaline phosphatase family protein [Luteimicrobium subarcticum]|uniref:Type I phosphodiesterase/nucleotide pyrophosphatase n=1 Tax=Luteimicrobium subarcticum TaxID=620910 RepID=A0A2M8WTW2_9MICO|nr:alkaline phosphatase family protein [Luteimicrobium subarcticum]PJI94380.1 type I phosphodiesterase/nucleotide pyrophosphatase [Luteimicrobium subarcticum]
MTTSGHDLRPEDGADLADRRAGAFATDLWNSVWSLVATTLGLGVALVVVPDVHVSSWWSVLLVALVVTLGDALLRAPLRVLARRFGPGGALLLGLLAQLAVAWAALNLLPGVSAESVWDAVAVLLLSAVVMVVGRWLIGLRDNDYALGDLRRRARRGARRAARRDAGGGPAPARPTTTPGLLVVQLDGLAAPTLEHAVRAGLAPNLASWLRAGTHRAETWWAQVPSTTPASQAGLLHGAADHVPAFRWWDRDLGRLLVTNHPADAAVLEERLSDGRGLLAGGGVAVSTMFSGDAASSLLVVSRARAGLGPGATFVQFFSSPFVLARAALLTVGELLKELYQGWQQTVRRVEPRVSRLGAYPVLRAITNVLLRDLNTSLVAEAMVDGAPVVFVDFVDYDEVAHHAGPLRPESLRSLEGLDRVVGLLASLGRETARPYEVVVLSDHGQSLGEPFAQAFGVTLSDVVTGLMAPESAAVGRPDAHGASERRARREDWRQVAVALRALGGTPREEDPIGPEPDAQAAAADVVVAASGNFAGVWLADPAGPVRLGRLVERWPDLVPGLAAHRGVGVVVVRDEDGVAVAVDETGVRRLVPDPDRPGAPAPVADGAHDPVARYGPQAAADLARAARLPGSPDVLVVSSVDDAGMVHPFEGLVGSHGGLGGEQNHAVLLHPTAWQVDDALRSDVGGARMLVGADAVHRQLVAWLEEHGERAPADGADDAGGDTVSDAPRKAPSEDRVRP